MSRVGKLPIKIQKGVKVQISNGEIKVEGPKGKLSRRIPEGVEVKVEGESVVVNRAKNSNAPQARALHGLMRALISNMVHGAAVGFTKELDIVGVGYRAQAKGSELSLTLGYSHTVEYKLPTGISAAVEKNTHIVLSGADRELLGLVAAKIRSFREPEPYQGKGIKYSDERIIRKQGKTAASGAK